MCLVYVLDGGASGVCDDDNDVGGSGSSGWIILAPFAMLVSVELFPPVSTVSTTTVVSSVSEPLVVVFSFSLKRLGDGGGDVSFGRFIIIVLPNFGNAIVICAMKEGTFGLDLWPLPTSGDVFVFFYYIKATVSLSLGGGEK